MGSKNQTSTSQQTSTPVNQAALQNIYNTVQGAASTPYTPYTGELTAGINGQQTAGINTINAGANAAQPYYQQAGQLATGAANPLSAAQIAQYQNPYTQSVVNATQAQFNDVNGQQQNSLKGTAAQQGALGGDRQAVAQAQLAGQQQLAQAPVIAGLYANSYNSGLQTAAQQYQQNPLAAASALGNIGAGTENAALAGGNAQLQAGTLQQQTQQAADTANYGQYQAQQAYPYQNAAFLEQYGLPAALGQGSTSSGTQTSPGPNPITQYGGLGVAAAGLFLKDGGKVDGYYSGGAPGYVNSRLGYIDSNAGYIPQTQASQNTLQAPQLQFAKPQQQASTPLTGTGSLAGLSGSLQNDFGSASFGGGNMFSGDAWGGDKSNPLPGLDASDYGYSAGGLVEAIHHIHKSIKRARGGAVSPFYADGGGPTTFDDRFSAAFDNPLLTRSMQAPDSGDPGVVNPDNPIRLDPTADQAWRDGVDQPNAAIVADSGMPNADDTAPNPMVAPSSLPPQITNPDNAPDQPSTALAFDNANPMQAPVGADGQPTVIAPVQSQPEQHFGHSLFGVNLSDKTRQALVAAGLGMMASRSPFAGVALGEGGLQGLKNYAESNKAEQEAQEKAVSQANEQQRINLQAKQIAQSAAQFAKTNALAERAQDEKGQMSEYQKAEVERQKRDEALKLKTPVKIGESVSGAPIMAMPKLNPKTNEVDLYPIGRDGTVAKDPITPGSNIRGVQPTSPDATSGTPAPGKPDPTAPIGSPESRNQVYVKQVEQEDPAYAAAIKKAADYELDPAKYASMRTSQRQKFINDVIQYDPNYNPQEVGLRYRAQAAFLPGTKNGDTVTAFNTAISHLDTLKQMYSALKNGDVQAFNHLKNTFQQQFGYAAPNDVAALSSIIGGEVVKATVGSQNALGDREEVRQSIGRDLSTQQADSVIDKYQALMAGQLKARKYAYEQSTGLHNFDDKFLLPRSREVLNSIAGEGGTKTGFTPPVGAIPRQFNGKTYYYDPNTKQPYPGQ